MRIWQLFAALILASLFLSLFNRRHRVRPLTDEARAEVERLALAGEHIQAMRAYRKATNASLPDAKKWVDAIAQRR